MTRSRILVAALALGAAALAGALWLQSRLAAAQRPGDAPSPAAAAQAPAGASGAPAASAGPAAPRPAYVEFSAADLLTVAPTSIERTIPITGTLKATQQALVRAKVAGELIELNVREAMPVSKGDVIARVDPADFQARVREREALERSARAQLEQARRTLENNRQLLTRNFISQNAFDNAQAGHDVAVANLDAATAQLAQARKALADTAVRSPMTGKVAERFVQPGEKVSPDVRIVSIVDLSRMEIEALVPSSDIGAVRAGQRVALNIEGIDGAREGRILRVAPSTAQGTRSVPIYIELENRDSRVPAGLFAQGSLTVERRDGALVVPEAAIRDDGGRSFVYVIEADRLAERTVKLGMRNPSARAPNGSTGAVEVTSGLAAGERIVAVNLGALRAGSPVRVSTR